MPSSTFLVASAPLHVAAFSLPSLLRALLPADVSASLSPRVSNEEVNAEPVLTAHALLAGRFPTLGKWGMEALLFVNAEAAVSLPQESHGRAPLSGLCVGPAALGEGYGREQAGLAPGASLPWDSVRAEHTVESKRWANAESKAALQMKSAEH